MTKKHITTREELLKDLEHSIEQALDVVLRDVLGALLRIQASTLGYCHQQDCGACKLKPLNCTDRLNAKVEELIVKHKLKKQKSPVHTASATKTKPNKLKLKKAKIISYPMDSRPNQTRASAATE